ncbi:benzoate/H(+) symporter BenE family transporter, partial [Kineococcus glutinatus]|uniref:benzoate/H(+) symporter BenE family transporter n=1 Tax=Kineococcus glutinatus TaxID=1070872 RepID=UPI0031E9BACD
GSAWPGGAAAVRRVSSAAISAALLPSFMTADSIATDPGALPLPPGATSGGPVPPGGRRPAWRDASPSAVVAGLVAVVVSYAGPFALVVQAAHTAGLDPARTASWVWALALGCALSGTALSLLTRTPVVVSYSTPGAALLIAVLGGYRFSDAVGAFLAAAVLATVLGATGWFGRALAAVPPPLLSGLLAGVLLPFVVGAVGAVAAAPLVAGAVAVAFLLARRLVERYAVPAALLAGTAAAALTGGLDGVRVDLAPTQPVWTTPTFDPAALLAIGLPLLLVTMASQNAPGLAVLRTSGYDPDDRLLVGAVSAVWALLAPFGGHATNLAALSAAICTGPDAHPDRARRYVAGVVCGLGNLVVAVFSAGLVSAFAALPAELVAALAGVALLGPLLAALRATTAADGPTGTAALLTLVVTASGVVVAHVGSAFWGLLAGTAAWLLLTAGRRRARPPRGRARLLAPGG